jgi:hypothetical protein
VPDTRVEDELAVTGLTGSEQLYCVQGGGPRKCLVSDIIAYAGQRYRLTGNTIFYWRSGGLGTGVDATINDDAHAFGSLQALYNWACANIDQKGFNLILTAGNAGFAWPFATGGLDTSNKPVGGGGAASLTIDWNGGSLTRSGGDCVSLGAANSWGSRVELTLQNVTLTTTTSGNCVTARDGIIQLGAGVVFGACAGAHKFIGHGAQIFNPATAVGTLTISGNATYHGFAYSGGMVVEEGSTVTISTPVTIGSYLTVSSHSRALMGGVTFVNKGNVTGNRAQALESSAIDTAAGGETYLPGTTAIVIDPTSSYDGNPGRDNGSAWIAFTPAISAASGTFTTVSGASAYKIWDKKLSLRGSVTCTTIGTAAVCIDVTIPVNIKGGITGVGTLINQSTNVMGSAFVGVAAANSVRLRLYDSTMPIANGQTIWYSAEYETA